MARVTGLDGVDTIDAGELELFLAEALFLDAAEAWLARFAASNVGAAICENIEAIRASSTRAADGTPGTDKGSYSFTTYPDHPSGHAVTQLDPYAVRAVEGMVRAMVPAEKYGASTRSVLRALGYADTAIDEMIAVGAVSESWSREYLPS